VTTPGSRPSASRIAHAETLPPLRVNGRRNALLHSLADHTDVDAFIVTNLVNVRWLTGFTGSAGMAILTPDELVLITDGRYDGQAHRELENAGSDARVIITSHEQRERTVEVIGDVSRIGLEAAHISWERQRIFRDSWFPDARLAATTGIVDQLRRRKDTAELARIERAAAITDAALAQVLPLLGTGTTERAFAFSLEAEMRKLGAQGPAFDTIVASGPNGALPHHRPGARVVSKGDLVVIDCGAMVDGYRSDMTRTVAVGDPTHTQQRMFDVVIEAQQAGFETVTADRPSVDVDTACRSVIDAAGWADAFSHGTGHGVGLDIHELPRIGKGVDDVLVEGDVITVEPGVYLPEHGGVRIEDTVSVGAHGARRITLSPKDLLAVPG